MSITVYRRAHFNAAHRLHNPKWNSEKNKEVFGKCNNPHYHGHNYEVLVGVKGAINPETGFVIDLNELKEIMKEEVIEYMDHKNLNIEVSEFKNLNPTAENIVLVIYNRLRKRILKENQLSVRLYETPRNFVEYKED